MKYRQQFQRSFGALALAVALATPVVTQAQTSPNGTPCTAPPQTFGPSGIPVTDAMCGQVGPLQVFLSSHMSYTSQGFSTNGMGTYYAAPGDRTGAPAGTTLGFATWNVAYASAQADQTKVIRLGLDLNAAVGAASFTWFTVPNNGWDSTNYGYLMGLGFNNNTVGEYTTRLSVYDAADVNFQSELGYLQINDVVGNPATTVPEPGTWALMSAGLAGIFGIARRRNKATRMPVSKRPVVS